MDRLAQLLERNGQSALGAELKSRISSLSGSASGGGRGSRGGLAAGTAPNRFGSDRASAQVEVVEADNLYKVYDPVGLNEKWTIHEVARVVTALPELRLPWTKGDFGASMEPLDEAIFKAGIIDSTTTLVDADVAAGNCAFGGSGDSRMHWTIICGPWLCSSTLGTRYARFT